MLLNEFLGYLVSLNEKRPVLFDVMLPSTFRFPLRGRCATDRMDCLYLATTGGMTEVMVLCGYGLPVSRACS